MEMHVDSVEIKEVQVNPFIGYWTHECQVWTTLRFEDKEKMLVAFGLEGTGVAKMEEVLTRQESAFRERFHFSDELMAEWKEKAQAELDKFLKEKLLEEAEKPEEPEE